MEIMERYINERRYMGLGNLLRRNNRAYFGLDFVYDRVPNQLVPFDYDAFAAYPGEVEAVVTDLATGLPRYVPVDRRDKTFQILRATCAMPLLFPTFTVEGAPCLDGGAADAIPYERAFAKGCDRLLVVLTKERPYRRQPEKLQPLINLWYRKYPKFCQVMATGTRPITSPESGCSSWSGKERCCSSPRRAPRASTAQSGTWRRSVPCGARAGTKPWPAWTKWKPFSRESDPCQIRAHPLKW